SVDVDIGPLNVRLESIHANAPPSSYVSFLGRAPNSRRRQPSDDTHSLSSVSSVRSALSNVSSLWSALSNSASAAERKQVQYYEDVKYLYSCFTKLPALRLSPDHRARLISGFEEFPFDTAVPLGVVFKNLGALEIVDIDYRQFFGWDRLAEQLRSLTLRRAKVDDPLDVLLSVILDDMNGRKRRSPKVPASSVMSTPGSAWSNMSPRARASQLGRSFSTPFAAPESRHDSAAESTRSVTASRAGSYFYEESANRPKTRQRSASPGRPLVSRPRSQQSSLLLRDRLRRSSGSSSDSTLHTPSPRDSTVIAIDQLLASKWQFLRHLSLAENGLTAITPSSLAPVAETLQSLDISGNLFTEIPDFSSLTHLRALNLSNCMIDSLNNLSHIDLSNVAVLNLRCNRLASLAGIERMKGLERVDLRDNRLKDPTELARLTGFPRVTDVYVAKNPFTWTHRTNYRITIFNVFRGAPGKYSDVTIDMVPATSAERKQLIDRPPASQALSPPVDTGAEARTPEEEPAQPLLEPVESQATAPPEPAPRTRLPTHRRAISDMDIHSASPRRKKPPRRRIVELTREESSPAKLKHATPDSRQSLDVPPHDEASVTPHQAYFTAPST
ncbi:hypothetical protein LTR95_018068, partial [Oleoguttula sp. CCFEE 5521]